MALGIPLPAVFRAATLDNARAFGLDGEIGAVAPGMQADLLLLRSNPLETVAAYDDIEMIVLDGVPIARPDLSASPDLSAR